MIRFRKHIDSNQRYWSPFIRSYTPALKYHVIDAIDTFNEEISWDGMWNMYDLEDRLKRGWVFTVLKLGIHIAGWTWLDTQEKYIRNVWVRESHQRKGWGSNLVKSTATTAYDLGISTVYSEVDTWNTTSIKMFETMGWERL